MPLMWHSGRFGMVRLANQNLPLVSKIVTKCRQVVADATTVYYTDPNLADFVHPHGLLINVTESSANEIFCPNKCWLYISNISLNHLVEK